MSQKSPLSINLFHIAYSEATLKAIPLGFSLLDNTAHERDDWREYWPIRRYLLSELSLEQQQHDAWYGFFSPRFREKTGLTPENVKQFIQTSRPGTDVVTFSPQPDMGAFFLSPFEQEEAFQPGFIETSQSFLARIGIHTDLTKLIMDSRQIVFSNYFVAKPAFWRRWLEINEQLFAICEGVSGSNDEPLRAKLTEPTRYPGGVQRKVFVMERVAPLMLAIESGWRVRSYNTFNCAWSATALNQFKHEAVISDALKIAMREQGFAHYFQAYSKLRERVV